MKNPSLYLDRAIKELSRLPGIGPKSASRVAFYILENNQADVKKFCQALLDLKENINECKLCGGISDDEVCNICLDAGRNHSLLCVVEEKKDILTIEKTDAYRGVYHVLKGVISPLDGIGPNELNIEPLLKKCKQNVISEIIIATNPTLEGDATSLYLNKIIKPMGIKITRIARGLPVGADIDFTDSATIAKSLTDRIEI